MAKLFQPLTLRGITFKNRIGVSPMCQYSATDGVPNSWHLVHLGSRAVGGAGLVMTEATAINPEGRISPGDTGIWTEDQMHAWTKIVQFIHDQDTRAGIQVAHAGRKASTGKPWENVKNLNLDQGGWIPVAPSPLAFDSASAIPRELTVGEIQKVIQDFEVAARNALAAQFDVLEIHAAHGYLLHEFLSPLSNLRTDDFGGSFINRIRLLKLICERTRKVWPESKPLLVRLSATDWYSEKPSWDVNQSVELARVLKSTGVDMIDVSSGGIVPDAKIVTGPGYQVPFAQRIRKEAEIPTIAVGLITEPEQAEKILSEESADMIFMAREFLREPYWPLRAAHQLNHKLSSPIQYGRAW